MRRPGNERQSQRSDRRGVVVWFWLLGTVCAFPGVARLAAGCCSLLELLSTGYLRAHRTNVRVFKTSRSIVLTLRAALLAGCVPPRLTRHPVRAPAAKEGWWGVGVCVSSPVEVPLAKHWEVQGAAVCRGKDALSSSLTSCLPDVARALLVENQRPSCRPRRLVDCPVISSRGDLPDSELTPLSLGSSGGGQPGRQRCERGSGATALPTSCLWGSM